jgi:exonuclease III
MKTRSAVLALLTTACLAIPAVAQQGLGQGEAAPVENPVRVQHAPAMDMPAPRCLQGSGLWRFVSAGVHDREGRVITAEFSDFFLVNVYVPNSGRCLTRLDYRVNSWGPDFLSYLSKLEERKPVASHDLNVAHKEPDLPAQTI